MAKLGWLMFAVLVMANIAMALYAYNWMQANPFFTRVLRHSLGI